MPDYTDVIASLMGGQLAAGPAHTAWPLPPAIGNLSSFLTPGVQMGGSFTTPGVGLGGPFSAPGISLGGAFETPGLSMGSGGVGTAGVLNTVGMRQREEAADKAAGKKAEAGTTGVSNRSATGRTPGGPVPADVSAISLAGLGPGQREEFLRRAMTLGLQMEKQTGIPAEAFAAMAANESNFGLAPGNIVGGVKASPNDPQAVWLDTWEMVNGQRVARREPFKASATAIEGMQHVAQLLQSGRYAPAYQALTSGAIDRDEFLRRVNAAGYATNPNWAQGEIVPLMGEAARYRPQAEATHADIRARNAAASTTAIEGSAALRGISQNAYAEQNGLPRNVAAAICGPVAVDAFARSMGRNPGPSEAFDLARAQNLWDLNSGAHGPESMVTLLGHLGVPAKTAPVTTPSIATEVERGRMVLIDTPGHYYQVTAYNPATQQFQFGDAVGAHRWATLAQLPAWGYGAARTAIVAKE